MHETHRPRARSTIGIVSVVAACLVAFVATACEPPPPPDGRDLGVTVTGQASPVVTKGQEITITGAVTNHGSAPAAGVAVTYVVSSGFVVDDLTVDAAAQCAAVNVQAFTCTLDGPLVPLATTTFVARITAGSTSGPQTLLAAANSDGSEPVEDASPNVVTFATSVRPTPAPSEPVGIGGGRNTLGTGNLVGDALPGAPSDGYLLAVNSYCSDKVNGDRFQSGYVGGACAGTINSEFRARGYDYAIDVPEDRTSDLRVLVWDASLNPNSPVDHFFQGTRAENFTFTLYAADDTPQDSSDNPVVCSRTFGPNTPFELTFLGSARWNELCTISPGAPSGRYLVRVHNQGEVTSPVVNGRNAFGLAAVSASRGLDPASALCAGSADQQCPVISGPGEASIDLTGATGTTRVRVGPVTARHEGRQLVLTLFDPAEGARALRVLAPTGTDSWAPAALTWSVDGGPKISGSVIDVSRNRLNGRLLTITVDLAGYAPPANNDLWQVEYQLDGGQVTDRTTWEATIVDVPAP